VDLSKTKSYEKAFDQDIEVQEIDSIKAAEFEVFGEERSRLEVGLKQRHIGMIALVGVFGTGIFLSSGGVLATTGPVGCLIAYATIALVVGLNQMCVAECAALMPCTSAPLRHAEQFIDPALGFVYGWMDVWSNIMPGEISATALIISYWTDISQGVWITIIMVLIISCNFLPIRYYGEIEFTFAIIKMLLLVGLIIVSIVITSGGGPNHKAIGFEYYRNPGPFAEYLTTGSLGKFAGFWKALSGTVYSFGGVQSVPNLAAEVKNPRRSIFTACKRILYRVIILMMLTVFCLTLIVPYNNNKIANSSGNASSSPFVVAMNNAGIKVLPHIINAAVLTSAFSAGNLSLMSGARILFALAVKGQAPKIFLKTTKRGVPWVGNVFVAIFMPLAYMNLSSSSANVFNWFQSLTSAKLLFNWVVIAANHIFMTRAMKAQGIPRSRLPHTWRFTPYAAWISGFFSLLFLLTGGFRNFVHGHFQIANFFSSYFIIPLSIVLFFGWKILKKTRFWRPEEVQLEVLFKDVDDNPEPPAEPLKGWRIITVLWA
jgi:amino acid transporter